MQTSPKQCIPRPWPLRRIESDEGSTWGPGLVKNTNAKDYKWTIRLRLGSKRKSSRKLTVDLEPATLDLNACGAALEGCMNRSSRKQRKKSSNLTPSIYIYIYMWLQCLVESVVTKALSTSVASGFKSAKKISLRTHAPSNEIHSAPHSFPSFDRSLRVYIGTVHLSWKLIALPGIQRSLLGS